MDITTVIKMLDADINQRKASKKPSNDVMVLSDLGAIKALENFRNHLQLYIMDTNTDSEIYQCCGGHNNMCDEECTQILNKTEE